jgi:hypothetical protein
MGIDGPACILCERFKPADGRVTAPKAAANFDTDTRTVECPRCGTYVVSGELYESHPQGLEERLGLKLSALTRAATDKRIRPRVRITEQNCHDLAKSSSPPSSSTGYVDAVLLAIADKTPSPGTTASVPDEPLAALAFMPLERAARLIVQMGADGLLDEPTHSRGSWSMSLTLKGWARIDALRAVRPSSDRAFVAMAFSAELKAAFDEGIRPALVSCGFEPPFRVDDPEHQARASLPDFQPKDR